MGTRLEPLWLGASWGVWEFPGEQGEVRAGLLLGTLGALPGWLVSTAETLQE